MSSLERVRKFRLTESIESKNITKNKDAARHRKKYISLRTKIKKNSKLASPTVVLQQRPAKLSQLKMEINKNFAQIPKYNKNFRLKRIQLAIYRLSIYKHRILLRREIFVRKCICLYIS